MVYREGEENEKECQKGEERGEVRANEEWRGRRERRAWEVRRVVRRETNIELGEEEEHACINLVCIQMCALNMFPQDYSKEGMTTSQEELMQHLRQFGLVYQRKVS